MVGGGLGKVKEIDVKVYGVFYYLSECFLFIIIKFYEILCI